MWLFADLFERYTSSVANTFLKIAIREAEANHRALQAIRAQRRDQRRTLEGRPEFYVPETLVHPVTGEALASDEPLDVIAEVAADPALDSATETAAAEAVGRQAVEIPMGVRGDVVMKYLDAFAETLPAARAPLMERLRKDKKVRVAELQVIVAEVLDEPLTHRKKADHLALLKAHLLPLDRPSSRAAATAHQAAI